MAGSFSCELGGTIMTNNAYSDPELTKTRRIAFAGLSGAEVVQVAEMLRGLPQVEAVPGEDGGSVVVTYCVADHTLAELEALLSSQGYRLESGLLERVRLGLIHFAEEIQSDNLQAPLRGATRDNRLHAIYANSHQRHLEDSAPLPPEELRNYF